MKSWTFQFLSEYWRVLTIPSLWRYRKALILEKCRRINPDFGIILTGRCPHRWTLTLRPASNDSYTFKEIFIDKVYERITHHITRVETIIDLGANIGMASIFLQGYWPNAKLICVEPAVDNIELLKKNLQRSIDCGTCQVLLGAVWGHSGTILISPLEKGHVNQRSCSEEQEGRRGQLVEAFTVQDIIKLSGFNNVDVLKMDVEGAEAELFRGNVDWLTSVELLAVEFHGTSRLDGGFDEILRKYGFTIVDEQDHTVLAKRILGE